MQFGVSQTSGGASGAIQDRSQKPSDCDTAPYWIFYLVRNEEAEGSNPFSSTKILRLLIRLPFSQVIHGNWTRNIASIRSVIAFLDELVLGAYLCSAGTLHVLPGWRYTSRSDFLVAACGPVFTYHFELCSWPSGE